MYVQLRDHWNRQSDQWERSHWQILKRNKVEYFYLTRSQIQKFKPYLQIGFFVQLEYHEEKVLKGKEADLNNSPGRDGGCITAGLFIGEFVGETPWVHIDIAGTSGSSKNCGYKSKGATGECARTLYNLAKIY